MPHEYISAFSPPRAPRTFLEKPVELQILINETVQLLAILGIPLDGLTPRRLEKMAIAVLAIMDVRMSSGWPRARDLNTPRALQTREIIRYWREFFGETISDGSYDDVRRKDLLLPYLAGLVVNDDPGKDTNDGTRRYALNPEFSPVFRASSGAERARLAAQLVQARGSLAARLSRPRRTKRTKVTLPTGKTLSFLGGPHNRLQKAIIEEFLPRFGFGAEVLYVADAAQRHSHLESDKLKNLRFFDLNRTKLPDVVAYSKSKNWVYVIEAVHSANPITSERRLVLSELLRACIADVIYVTAFPDRAAFRRFAPDIAWETEVWIASEPDHLIHFNGDKFLGPFPAG